MSALAAQLRRTSGPVDEDGFGRVFRALSASGHDGSDTVELGPVRIGHQHLWTTPEEVGERQPLSDGPGGRALAFVGRLDNRSELLGRLDGVPGDASDARLVLASHGRWGERFVDRLLGPFALVLFDARRRSLLCARDPLGVRSLFYTLSGDSFLAASEESALLAHPGVADDLDEESVARYFARRGPRPGRTLYRAIAELEAGRVLRVGPEDLETRTFWALDELPDSSPRRSDAAWAEELRATLEASVAARLRSPSDPWVLLSGGLDSASVAALGAAIRRRRGEGPLRAVSWVFDRLPQSDESRRIGAVVERLGLDWFPVVADDSEPLADLASWPRDPSRAESDPFGWTVDRAYRTVRDHGGRALLTGYWGNHLCAAGGGWMESLLRRGRFVEAVRAGWSWLALQEGGPVSSLFRGARTLVRRGPGSRRERERRWLPWLPWFTETGCGLLGGAVGSEEPGVAVMDPVLVWGGPSRWRRAAWQGIDLRDPYRDLRLVELARRMPTHQLQRGGWSRYVVRRALTGSLPDSVAWAPDRSTLGPFLRRGIRENRRVARDILWSDRATWHRYIRAEVVNRVLSARGANEPAPELYTLTWLALGFEEWRRGGRAGGVIA